MREHASQGKKTTTGFSIPSLKHPIRGFGLESSAISRQAVPEIQPLHKSLTHDISRIPLRSPQAKLSISQPGDKYEQEADSVAQQVMQRMAQPVNRQSIQREALPEEEEELQMKSLDISTLQREVLPEDEEELQMKSMVQRQGEASMAAAPDLETSINQARGGGVAIADNIREPIEQAFGADFSGVKVHTDGQSDQLNRSIQARAFTTGQDVFFRQGEYNPGSRGGQELLAHELTHVVQQNGGAVMRSPLPPQPLPQYPLSGSVGKGSTQPKGKLPGNSQVTFEANGQNVVQRKIGNPDNVIFGLDGKNDKAIKDAVQAGYTTFDGADSYGNTIESLANAIKEEMEKGKSRKDFEVIYKVDETKAEDLENHIKKVANMFGGYLDHVLIHKVTDQNQVAAYNPILTKLKADGVARAVGAGDVKGAMKEQFDSKDSFEVNAIELFIGDHKTLITNLNEAAKPVFVYNVVGALKSLLKIGEDPTQLDLQAMVGLIKNSVPKAEPILSSSSRDRQDSNLKVFDIKDYNEEAMIGEIREVIEKVTQVNKEGVSIKDIPDGVKSKLTDILFGQYNWNAGTIIFTEPAKINKLNNCSNEELKVAYETEKIDKLKNFTSEELAVEYQGVGADKAKTYSVEQLIGKLFDHSKNCNRTEASNFLNRGFGYLE
ncbi:aldo/keto reductase [Nostoc sp.]|uniref:aldo/keto reductase n=1 Tax=Nostoc sp. TaxID=1180 RepID=UPI002FF49FFE